MKALEVRAGPKALAHLRERGLQPADVRIIPAAAGGPKGLVLNPLDRFLFGSWFAESKHPVHLLGASIGAWRMASACLRNPDAELAQMADDYIHQHYDHAPGRSPTASHVSEVFGAKLRQRFDGRAAEVLEAPRYRLHVFTSRGRRLLQREGAWRTPAGYAAAFASNIIGRRSMGTWLERVIFSDPREALPFPFDDYRSQQVALSADNLAPAILASCSIPFWLRAVQDPPGAPAGAYWDGGITDYHLHLQYSRMCEGLVLYPHFQRQLVPGWLDKALHYRHRATDWLSNVVVLSPSAEWIATLPNGKLPDRTDFKAFGDDLAGRVHAWSAALAASERLAEEFSALVRQPSIESQPLV